MFRQYMWCADMLNRMTGLGYRMSCLLGRKYEPEKVLEGTPL